jgi:hypothetical protein
LITLMNLAPPAPFMALLLLGTAGTHIRLTPIAFAGDPF